MAIFHIIRKQVNSVGFVVDIKKLVGIDGSGVPSFVSFRSNLHRKYFTSESWALKNMDQCNEYFEKNPGPVKFLIEMISDN